MDDSHYIKPSERNNKADSVYPDDHYELVDSHAVADDIALTMRLYVAHACNAYRKMGKLCGDGACGPCNIAIRYDKVMGGN